MDLQKELNVMFYQTTALYPSSSVPKVPDEELRKKCASYFAMVELIDWNVGRLLLEMLDNSGLRKNTIVILHPIMERYLAITDCC